MDKRFSPKIPKGFKIFIRSWDNSDFDGVTIAGLHISENRYWALKFAEGKGQYITLEREPNNKYDKNAVAVIANWKGWLFSSARHIGYIPREIAKEMAKHPPLSNFCAVLNSIYVSANNYVSVRIDVLFRENIESLDEKEEKEAWKLRSLSPIDQAKKELLDYLNNCREDYGCKKLSKKVVNEVFPKFLSQVLKESGISEAELNDLENEDAQDLDVVGELESLEDEIFEEILRIHPNLKKNS